MEKTDNCLGGLRWIPHLKLLDHEIYLIISDSINLFIEARKMNDYSLCLSNCRRALEGISTTFGFNGYKSMIQNLDISRIKKKAMKSTYDILSTYGSHYRPTVKREDMKSGYFQTLAVLSIIIELRKQGKLCKEN